MCPGAAPVWEQVAIGTIGPPAIAILFLFRARGWAWTVQGGSVSERTRRRQKIEFWILLAALYVMAIGVFGYAAWKCKA